MSWKIEVSGFNIPSGFFLVPSTFTYKKSQKHIKSIKNVIISNLISLYTHMLKIKDSFSFSFVTQLRPNDGNLGGS